MRKVQKYKATIHPQGLELPVDITLERRQDTRFGMTGRRVTLRLPVHAPAARALTAAPA